MGAEALTASPNPPPPPSSPPPVWARRIGAAAIDLALVLGGAWALIGPLERLSRQLLGAETSRLPASPAIRLEIALCAALAALHYLVNRMHLSGKTPGRAFFRLLVVHRRTGGRAGARRAFARDLLAKGLPLGFWPAFAVLAAPKLLSPRTPLLHEWWSNTRVVDVAGHRGAPSFRTAWIIAGIGAIFAFGALPRLLNRPAPAGPGPSAPRHAPAAPSAAASTRAEAMPRTTVSPPMTLPRPAAALPASPPPAPPVAAAIIRCGDPGVTVFPRFLLSGPGQKLQTRPTCIQVLTRVEPTRDCQDFQSGYVTDDLMDIADRCQRLDPATQVISWKRPQCARGVLVSVPGLDFCGIVGPAADR
jgi:hypothetical protein